MILSSSFLLVLSHADGFTFTFVQYCMWVLKIYYIQVENCNKIAHYDAMVRQRTNDSFFLNISQKQEFFCLAKIVGLVFRILCICWAINWWYTELWPGVALVNITNIRSFQWPPLFFWFSTITHSRSRGINTAFVFQVVFNSGQELKKMSSNQWMIMFATWIIFGKKYGKTCFYFLI